MTTPVQFMGGILARITTAKQLDVLHLSIINLLDMSNEGELDLIIEQAKKTPAQKTAFLRKVIMGVESPELAEALNAEVKAQNFDFFLGKYLGSLLGQLQREAERIVPVKMSVAIEFEKKDLREMVDRLTKALGRPAVLDVSIDRSLIAGAVVQHGNYISDYSVKTRLEQFRAHWKEAVVEKA